MNLREVHKVYFIGIGGIGMSALAQWFKTQGKEVSGYDKTPSPVTQSLLEKGIHVHFEDAIEAIPFEPDLVVFTPAIPAFHKGLQHFKNQGVTMLKRAQVLGLISNAGQSIAVAGTHGKTTTSAMLAHIYNTCLGNVNAFVGGIMANYNSNFLGGEAGGKVILEADEFDRSFLQLKPYNAAITSTDADHLDIYGSESDLESTFSQFGSLVTNILLVKKDLDLKISGSSKVYSYGIENHADFAVQNINVNNGKFVFDLKYPEGCLNGLELAMPGRHNVENAAAAIGLSLLDGIQADDVKDALASFKGVKRRFEHIAQNDKTTYIDDYAHHPKELNAAISAAKELFKDKKITGIFQPHLFSRTRDFMPEFAKALEALDTVLLLDIYPAREEPISGVTSSALLDLMDHSDKRLVTKDEVVALASELAPEVLMTLGAGDIDRLVQPLKTAIETA